MKKYKVKTVSKGLFASKLPGAVERMLREQTAQGWEIVSVSFSLSLWWIPVAYLTFSRDIITE